MDEDQVNEEQGSNPERQEVTFKQAEQDDTPSKGMFSSVLRRDPVNLYSFLGKQNDDVNERINGIESQLVTLNNNNRQQRSNFEQNLININVSLQTLEQGLTAVSDKLELSQQLEKIKDANQKAREQQLADQQLREGKESLVEKKMQTALAAPLQKIGVQAQSILGNIMKFFNTILLGIIGTRGIQVIGKLINDNQNIMETIKSKVVKELGIATGIFLAINGGLAIALRSVIRLTGFVSRIAFTNLLIRPIRAIFDLVARGAILKGVSNAGGSGGVPPGVPGGGNQKTKTTQKGKVKSSKSFGLGRYFLPTASAGLRVLDEYQSGERDPAKLITAGVIDGLSLVLLNKLKLGTLATAGLYFLSREPVDQIIDVSQKLISGENIDQIGNQVQERQLELRNKSNKVVVVDDDSEETSTVTGSAGIADASALLAVASGNTDNPYLMNSLIQYNVML
jgi:hypothetical protein